MKKIRFIHMLIFFSCCYNLSCFCQNQTLEFKDFCYDKNIKSAKIYRSGWELSEPIISLNKGEKLELIFDDITEETKYYSYTILHYNSEYKLSNLIETEYISGYYEADIRDYTYSFNTTYKYIHYSLTFPNEDMSPKISGNYLLLIYKDYNKEQVVLTKRFYVLDERLTIDAKVKRPNLSEYYDKGQKIDLKVKIEGYNIRDPFSDIKIVIVQNGNFEKSKLLEKPLFLNNDILDYTYEKENTLYGGKEFRYFDIKSIRYQSEYIQNIEFENPYFHVYLKPDEDRTFKPYYYINDLNGKYFIDLQEGRDKHIEADYVLVHFQLLQDVPLANEEVYLYGELTNWNIDDYYKMEYNFNNHAYEKTLLLKQGYYNYQFAVKREGFTAIDFSFFEGNNFETENDYQIFIYHSDYVNRYEKLIGYLKINSLK